MRRFLISAGVAAAAMLCGPAYAADLKIAYAQEPTSIDPHFHNSGVNSAFVRHIFDPLIINENGLKPGLATSWKAISDTEWEIKLRKGVTFHDGSPFDAADVIFTIERLPNVPDSPSSFASSVKPITKIEVIDSHTLKLITDKPSPVLPNKLAEFTIVSDEVGKGSVTADYTTGKAMVGTGPYRFVSSRASESYKLARNESYWRGVEPWETVEIQIVESGPARTAALLSGELDLIERVPSNDVPRLNDNAATTVHAGPTNRVVFVSLDVQREAVKENYARDNDGNALSKNPMMDKRVRKALSMAIPREALIERALGGDGVLSSNLVPPGFFGYDTSIPVETYDPEGAKKLIVEAGYPDGFEITFHASTDRIAYAPQVAQVLAQSWTRIGVETSLETMPHSVYIPKTNAFDYAYMLHSWGTASDAGYTLNGIAVTRDKPNGKGPSNRGRYSNPDVDRMVAEAQTTLDAGKREKLLHEAMAITIGDYGIIPLYAQKASWGTSKGISYSPAVDLMTLAMRAKPAN